MPGGGSGGLTRGRPRMADGEDDGGPDDGARRDDLRGRHAEEEPVVGLERLDDEADSAVPDEERQEQFARPEPAAKRPGAGSGESAPRRPESDS